MGTCRWFAMCTNEATTTLKHPVLGGSANLQALQGQGRETQRFLRSDKLASDKLAKPHQPPAGEALHDQRSAATDRRR